MSNPSRSSIRIGSTSVGSKDASESGRTDPPPAPNQNSSSSCHSPQSGTELPSSTGTEGSYASPPPALTPPSTGSICSQITPPTAMSDASQLIRT
ncbi:hypothetical protein P9112_001504 [Eukaryota sp. TZLM1-RC]